MDSDNKGGIFICSCCAMQETYHYFGKEPAPKTSKFRYNEDVFLCRNPFLPATVKPADSDRPYLVLGGQCSDCHVNVCLDGGCSLYFEKRLCVKCALDNHLAHLPSSIVSDLQRRKEQEVVSSSTD